MQDSVTFIGGFYAISHNRYRDENLLIHMVFVSTERFLLFSKDRRHIEFQNNIEYHRYFKGIIRTIKKLMFTSPLISRVNRNTS